MDILEDAIERAKKEFTPNSELKNTEKEVIERFGKIFNMKHIDQLTWNEFKDFTSKTYNQHWSNMQRYNGALKRDFEILKKALKILLDEELPIADRLRKTFSRDAQFKAKGTGPAILTSILTVAFPQKYAVYNDVTIRAANLALKGEHFSKPKFIDEYEHFNEKAKEIAFNNGLTLWELDWVWFYIISNQSKGVDHNIIDEKNDKKDVNKREVGTGYKTIHLPINIILYGPVGTGKTLLANKLATGIINGSITSLQQVRPLLDSYFEDPSIDSDEHIKNVTFHKSYGYEQFIEGILPEIDKDGKTSFSVKDGTLKTLSNSAKESLEKGDNSRFVMVIDEINRGDISRIFGELITLIEENKRKNRDSPGMETKLLYSQKEFSLPINLFLIGTMNTTDKSIALLDLALRRRFCFIEVRPNIKLLKKYLDAKNLEVEVKSIVIFIFKKLNEKIIKYKGEDYGVGHAYFMDIRNVDDLFDVWNFKIMPLLKEYFYDEEQDLMDILRSIAEVQTLDNESSINLYSNFQSPSTFIEAVKRTMNGLENPRQTDS